MVDAVEPGPLVLFSFSTEEDILVAVTYGVGARRQLGLVVSDDDDDATTSASTYFAPLTPTHLCVTVSSGGTHRLFVNGVLTLSVTLSEGIELKLDEDAEVRPRN
jgi:hypothetical protein